MNQLIRFIRAQGPPGRGRFSSCLPAPSLAPLRTPRTPAPPHSSTSTGRARARPGERKFDIGLTWTFMKTVQVKVRDSSRPGGREGNSSRKSTDAQQLLDRSLLGLGRYISIPKHVNSGLVRRARCKATCDVSTILQDCSVCCMSKRQRGARTERQRGASVSVRSPHRAATPHTDSAQRIH
ncbi:unnamed protein product [Danaus chrysippus]|uniref:(African queen) hypothetical protein n=1 Tax=Danaus chrysippus TaxID=151541 RepID=A0A8J2MJ26_9NEOP|nr:unnamed protein product [Danaus chrysippus]